MSARQEVPILAFVLPPVALTVLWAAHDGGYDPDTWYWGALLMLALVGVTCVVHGTERLTRRRSALIAVTAFAGYVGFSYLSMLWAQTPGLALTGANRALLYLLLLVEAALLPWTGRRAVVVVGAFLAGIGVLAAVELARVAAGDSLARAFVDGRLVSPTGYFNGTCALFTSVALTALALAARRSVPWPVRGALATLACAGLELAVLGQSRGWLFTLPFVLLATAVVIPDRIRVALTALPVLAGLATALHRLLRVHDALASGRPSAAAFATVRDAGHTAILAALAAGFVVALLALLDQLRGRDLGRRAQRVLGAGLVALAVGASVGVGLAATHGDPGSFLSRQWHGFTAVTRASGAGSHFSQVGSGRYDFWRVAWHAALDHPLGGLGQDNFGNLYVTERRTSEEPLWVHSLWLRLLAHTGIAGFLLFVGCLVAVGLTVARPGPAQPPPDRSLARIALIPGIVWLGHGSVDWFWELPALAGPVFAFAGIALALTSGPPVGMLPRSRQVARRAATVAAGALALIAATVALGFPYLAVRETSRGVDVAARDPHAALADLALAARFDPFAVAPPRIAGAMALLNVNEPRVSLQRFAQATERDPGSWLSWLGRGLAASVLGDRASARSDLLIAARINPDEPLIRDALARVDSARPATPAEIFGRYLAET